MVEQSVEAVDIAAHWAEVVDPTMEAIISSALGISEVEWPDARTGLISPAGTGGAARAFIEASPDSIDRWILLDDVAQRLDLARSFLDESLAGRSVFCQSKPVDELALASGVLSAALLLPSPSLPPIDKVFEHIQDMLVAGAPVLYVDLPCDGLIADLFIDALGAHSPELLDKVEAELRPADRGLPAKIPGWQRGAQFEESAKVNIEDDLDVWWVKTSVRAWLELLGRPQAVSSVSAAVIAALDTYGAGHKHQSKVSLRATWWHRTP